MVLIGGLIIDRIGTKKAALIFSLLVFIGAFITVLKGDIYLMAAGRLIFGLGAESMIVAITTVVAQWFKGKQLSFAFGLNLTVGQEPLHTLAESSMDLCRSRSNQRTHTWHLLFHRQLCKQEL
jgi:hypothetical protein